MTLPWGMGEADRRLGHDSREADEERLAETDRAPELCSPDEREVWLCEDCGGRGGYGSINACLGCAGRGWV